MSQYISPDPDLVTHADGSQTYTPGLKGRKLIALLFGASLTLFGIFWSWQPLRLVLLGESAEAKVAFVIEEKPGQEPIKHDTRRSVQAAEDPTRNATYYYHLRFVTATGQTITAPLNYGQVLRPILSIGDRIQIVYAPEAPEVIVDKWSIRTWAFGIFFTGIGLMIFISQLFIYRAADRPILLDSIQDYATIVQRSSDKPSGSPDKPTGAGPSSADRTP